jgi:hypothetical protein
LMIYILGRLVHFAAPMFVGIEIKLIWFRALQKVLNRQCYLVKAG